MAAMMGGMHHMNRPPSNSMGSRGAGQQPPPPQAQPPYKGTLPPGTKVAVGNVTVTVKRYLSEGGFAHVYLVTSDQPIPIPIASSGSVSASVSLPGSQARRTRPETLHVLKRMAVPDKDALATVRSEVERLLRNQPNVVHFIEASASSMPGGGYEIFILMEYCAGGGIIDLMNARLRDRLREPEVLKIFGDVCAGVSVMHHLDPPLMHRDIKIENILLSPASPDQDPGAGPTYKLCDFGSAAPVLSRRAPKSLDEIKRLEADLNRATTLQYRAPEMVDVYQKRVIDEKADIWALGVLLYKLCYYTTPFEENGGGPLAILSANYRFPPMPVYSQNLKDLIASMLREQSTDRPTVDQLIVRVHQLLGSKPPAIAAQYAEQAAAGKQVQPMPTLVSKMQSSAGGGAPPRGHGYSPSVSVASRPGLSPARRQSSMDDTAILEAEKAERRKGPLGSGVGRTFDLASPSSGGRAGSDALFQRTAGAGATEEALRRAEVAALKEGVTPMRRGRPTKGPTTPAAEASTPTKPAMKQLTGEQDGTSSSPGPRNLGSSFAESRATFAGSGARPGASSKPLISGFDDAFTPSALDVPSSKDKGRPTSAPGIASSTPPNLLEHSPDLPGFDSPSLTPVPTTSLGVSSPPATSPLARSPLGPSAKLSSGGGGGISERLRNFEQAKPSSNGSAAPASHEDDASTRFPSVDELDARYATSPSPSTTEASVAKAQPTRSSNAALPTLPSRSRLRAESIGSPTGSSQGSVGAIASRLNGKSDAPAASPSSPSGGRSPPLPASSKPSVGSIAGRWPHASAASASPSFGTSAPRRASALGSASPDLGSTDAKKQTPARDWLTGDDSEEVAPRPQQQQTTDAPSKVAAPEASSSSDDEDEAEGPEEIGQSAAERYGGGRAPAGRDQEEAPPLPLRSSSPGAKWEAPPISSLAKEDDADAYADEDDKDLALIEGRLSSKQTPLSSPPLGGDAEASRRFGGISSSRVLAPDWDEMDESEVTALAQLPVLGSTPRGNVAASKPVEPVRPPTAAAAPPPAATEAPKKQYADASTSPIEQEPPASIASRKTSLNASGSSPAAPSHAGPSLAERMQGLQMASGSSSSSSSSFSRLNANGSAQPAPEEEETTEQKRRTGPPPMIIKPKPASLSTASSTRAAEGPRGSPMLRPKPDSALAAASASASLAASRFVQQKQQQQQQKDGQEQQLSSSAQAQVSAAPVKPEPPAIKPKPASLKPWEREAAAAAEFQRAGLVRSGSSILRSPSPAKADSPSDDAPASTTGKNTEAGEGGGGGTAMEKKPSGSGAGTGEAQERFRGVSDLISRWQANAASNAPGWGKIGAAGDVPGGAARRKM